MLRHVDRYIISDVSKDRGTFIFRVKQSKKTELLHLKDEDTTILPNVVIYQLARRNFPEDSNLHIYYLGAYCDW
jgi:hypothetical protein